MEKEAEEHPEVSLPVRPKKPRQQLNKAMEHMRSYVTVPDVPQDTSDTPSADLGEDAYGVPASYGPRP